MNSILVPTDFSSVADNAMNYAISMADYYQLDIILYHVVQMSSPDVTEQIHLDFIPEVTENAKHKLNEKVKLLKTQFPQISFHTKVEYGLFLESLKKTCEDLGPICMVMGISGNGDGMDKIIGSNALNVMTELKFPLIIAPKHATFKPIENICFACDLKNVLSSTPILALKAFSKLFNANMHILNIDYNNKNFTPDTQNDLIILNDMLDHIKHEFHFIVDENVQHAIDIFVNNHPIDMLIMLPKKHSFFASLFHKSQSKEMAYHSHIPLLALHQD
jgi:nucleotide-binding universal stress UspA family protein